MIKILRVRVSNSVRAVCCTLQDSPAPAFVPSDVIHPRQKICEELPKTRQHMLHCNEERILTPLKAPAMIAALKNTA